MWVCCQIVSILPFSNSLTFHALLAKSGLLFCLWLNVVPSQHVPNAQFLWCLHHCFASPLSLCLLLLLLSLLPSRQATSVAAAWFLFSSSVLGFVVSALPTISSLFRPLSIYSHLLLLSFCLFFNVFSVTLSSLIFLALSSAIISCLVLHFSFFCSAVLSFILFHILLLPPFSFLCLTGP